MPKQGCFVIYEGSKKSRKKRIEDVLENAINEAQSNNPNILVISERDARSLGVEVARNIRAFLKTRPFGGGTKQVIVYEAQRLSELAQNILLKTLEELPTYATVILETNNKNALLETVLSRCFLMHAQTAQKKRNTKKWEIIKSLPLHKKLELAERLEKKPREEIIETLKEWAKQETANLTDRTDVTTTTTQNLETLVEAIKNLKTTNVNVGLCLDYVLLTIK